MAAIDPQTLPDAEQVGAELHDFVRRLFPLCRSITGEGLRQTLALIGERIPLEVTEVPRITSPTRSSASRRAPRAAA